MSLVYFAGSILIVCIAQFIREIRWELFIELYERPDRRNLIQALSLGHLINYFLPFRLGDLIRAWFAGRRMKNGLPLGLSTVIIDRFLDVFCVGIIFAGLSIFNAGLGNVLGSAAFYILTAVALVVIMAVAYGLRNYVKKAIRGIASIFNPTIESRILRLSWALIWNFKDIFQKISKVKLICTTIGMWAGYLLSYALFAGCLRTLGGETTWADVFIMLFTQNGILDRTSAATLFANGSGVYSTYTICYMLLPLLLMLILSLFIQQTPKNEEENYLNLLPHLDPEERLRFLESYFSNANRDYVNDYLKINQNISIIRDYSAGSNATTILCTDGNRTFFRKYAFGEDGEKLGLQIDWIQENINRIPLPEIIKTEKTDVYCFYDMPFSSNSVGLFEYAHSMPVENSWRTIRSALESLENSIYRVNMRSADKETVHEYIQTKVLKNLEKIKNARYIRNLQQYGMVEINGVEYRNLSFYEKYLEEEYLQRVFENDACALIHGDLTVENIICTRDEKGNDAYYLIDPNTGNIHESPNLDYAKLLQSIHGGYEFLKSTKDVNTYENKINFVFTRSAAYVELHQKLHEHMLEHFGRERTKSIYFHEIIHWLRLLPYRIEKDGKRALLFYAGMLIVMNDVYDRFIHEGSENE